MAKWPEWRDWELEISDHMLIRMSERDFNEVDIRRIFSAAHAIRRDVVPGRWIVASRIRGRAWEIVVEPDAKAHVVVVITAYDATL